jgi:predicted NBD/HSP70 family sugar kinase
VVDSLRELGVASRAEIARHTGLSRSTVSSLVTELRGDSLIVDRPPPAVEDESAQAGRPPNLISLGRRAGAALGVDFGKRHVAVAVGDLSRTILSEESVQMQDGYSAEEGIRTAAGLIDRTLADSGTERAAVLGVGVGVPGPIHLPSGQLGSAAILPGWAGLRVAEEMERCVGLPVHVDNDANLGALAELHWGAGQGASSLIYMKVATGIGAGLVIDGRIYHGAGGTAGEIGHTTIDEHGEICRCGSRGCLETLAGAPAIVAMLRGSLGEDITIEDVLERVAAGDPASARAIEDSGRHIGSTVADACNLLNPERLVVGGSVGQAGEVLLKGIAEGVRRRAIASAAEDLDIRSGVLGERAELLGAVASALERIELLPLEAARLRTTA